MFHLKKLINYQPIRSVFRNYVSLIDIHVDKIKALKIKPEFDSNEPDSEIKIEVLDGDKNLIKLETVARIHDDGKKFTLEAHETDRDDLTFILELPMNVFNDLEIKTSAVKGFFTHFLIKIRPLKF